MEFLFDLVKWFVLLPVGIVVGLYGLIMAFIRSIEFIVSVSTLAGLGHFLSFPGLFVLRHFVFHAPFLPTEATLLAVAPFFGEILLGIVWWRSFRRLHLDPSPPKQFMRMDLLNKVAVITGGNSGIGFEAAKALALRGATVVIGCRSAAKGRESVDAILKVLDSKSQESGRSRLRSSRGAPGGSVFFLELDLDRFSSVKKFHAELVHRGFDRIDILINNAGYAPDFFEKINIGLDSSSPAKEGEGIERGFATMHLAHFYLTKLLLPMIPKGTSKANNEGEEDDSGRIVIVSSFANRVCPPEKLFANLHAPTDPSVNYYCRAKLTNLLFSQELQRRLKQEGSGIKVFSLHPGGVATPIFDNKWGKFLLPGTWINRAVNRFGDYLAWWMLRTPEAGASDIIYAATVKSTAPLAVKGAGGHLTSCKLASPLSLHLSPAARPPLNEELGKKLWALSEQLLAPHFQKNK